MTASLVLSWALRPARHDGRHAAHGQVVGQLDRHDAQQGSGCDHALDVEVSAVVARGQGNGARPEFGTRAAVTW